MILNKAPKINKLVRLEKLKSINRILCIRNVRLITNKIQPQQVSPFMTMEVSGKPEP